MKSIAELMSLQGRVALVTGGAGHIGQACCETFAELGAATVILDIQSEKCQQVADRISRQYGTAAVPLEVDLAKEDDIRSVPETLMAKFGRLDILVNCAALVGTSELKGWTSDFLTQSSAIWKMALDINLTAPFVLVQSCVPVLKKSPNASIININSIYGVVGPDMRLYRDSDMGSPAAYAASKGGLLQFTRWLAAVLAPDVRVNSISAGGISRNQPVDFQKRYIERTPLQRMGAEEDLKGAAAYLASDLSAYVTGHNLMVDGGFTVR